VLAAVDLSPISHDVLAAACASLRPGGTLTVFHAYEAPFADRLDAYGVAGSAIDVYIEGERQRHGRDLEALVASLGADAEARVVVERGNPIDPLFRQIEELEPGLVVVGRGRGAARRTARAPGSVSRHVASFSPENVLVVPASAAKILAAE
jgi:nucleotide-binding universal stress UspA family protein